MILMILSLNIRYNFVILQCSLFMSNLELRQQVQSYIDQLSTDKLLLVADFLVNLLETEDNEATEELLKIEGFKEAFAQEQKNVKENKVISVEQLKRKY